MRWYSEVFDLIFPQLDREKANKSRIIEDDKSEKEESKKKNDDDE